MYEYFNGIKKGLMFDRLAFAKQRDSLHSTGENKFHSNLSSVSMTANT